MTERYDAIVIGAGHNGLACAGLLAKGGRRVLVLEAASAAGGAARTEAFADGYRVSSCAHLLTGLNSQLARELGLAIDYANDDAWSVALDAGGRHLRWRRGKLLGGSEADATALSRHWRRMSRFAGLLDRWLNRTPPRLGGGGRRDLLSLGLMGFDLRRLGRGDMREFLRLIGMNIYDELYECFESPLLQGALSLDAVLGTHLGPRSPNTMLTGLYRLAGGGRLGIPAGGMGAVGEALLQNVRGHGVEVRTGCPVKRVIVDNGRATGVETADGEQFESLTVVSSADPKRTVFDLVGARHFETGFTSRIHNLRMRGNAAKLHLALDGLPVAEGLEKKDFAGRLLVAPDADYVERAFNPAKYGECSPEPVMEITVPSFSDTGLAPAGKQVMSIVVQYAPYALEGGWSDAARKRFEDSCLRTLATYLPDLPERVLHSELLVPTDIEERFGLGGGHWHHGELTLDQFLFVRPVGGAAQYALPLEGLWLCGAGAHPGGNVTGTAGRNAAREILRREK